MKGLVTGFSVVAVLVMAGTAQAVVVNGDTIGDGYGAALAVQTVQTQFGDNLDPNGFSNEGELDAGYALIDGGRLYVMLTGNIGQNFNKVSVFIDSKAGGENILDGSLAYDFGNVSSNFGGLTFDTGFEADYHVFGRWGGGAFEVDIVDRSNSTAGSILGDFGAATTGAGTGIQSGTALGNGTGTTSFLSSPLEFGFNNTNVAGVIGGTAAANQVAAAAVTTGFEFSVALVDIGYVGGPIKIHAAYGNGDNNFHSNQILGGLPAGTGNLGGDGAGNFTGNLAGIDFNNFAGNQYFVIPEPASMALLGLGGLAMLRRRA